MENVVPKKYVESRRRASNKYRETHKEQFCEYQKKYYHAHKDDENYMNKQREKALKYYYKKKESLKKAEESE